MSLRESRPTRSRRPATRIASFVSGDPASTIFTCNATEAINLVAYAWAATRRRGDEVLITEMEHHSNIVPWQLLARRPALSCAASRSTDCTASLDELDALLAEGRVKLLAVVHVSNVLGTINPVAEIVRARRGWRRALSTARRPCRSCLSTSADRRRLLRLDRPQGARPDDRRAPRPTRDPEACVPLSAAAT